MIFAAGLSNLAIRSWSRSNTFGSRTQINHHSLSSITFSSLPGTQSFAQFGTFVPMALECPLSLGPHDPGLRPTNELSWVLVSASQPGSQ